MTFKTFLSLFVVLGIFYSTPALANGGHHAVTLPKDCSAFESGVDVAAPALHYMNKSYARCLRASQAMLNKTAKEQQPAEAVQSTSDVANTSSVPQIPKNYYRVTPVKPVEALVK